MDSHVVFSYLSQGKNRFSHLYNCARASDCCAQTSSCSLPHSVICWKDGKKHSGDRVRVSLALRSASPLFFFVAPSLMPGLWRDLFCLHSLQSQLEKDVELRVTKHGGCPGFGCTEVESADSLALGEELPIPCLQPMGTNVSANV